MRVSLSERVCAVLEAVRAAFKEVDEIPELKRPWLQADIKVDSRKDPNKFFLRIPIKIAMSDVMWVEVEVELSKEVKSFQSVESLVWTTYIAETKIFVDGNESGLEEDKTWVFHVTVCPDSVSIYRK